MQRLEKPGCLQPVGVGVGGSQNHKVPLSHSTRVPARAGVLSVQLERPSLSCFVFLGLTAYLSYLLMVQTVKNLPAMRETWVRSLGWEDPLEKEMAVHSSSLAWKTPWAEEPGRLQSMGSLRVGHD